MFFPYYIALKRLYTASFPARYGWELISELSKEISSALLFFFPFILFVSLLECWRMFLDPTYE